MYTIVVQCTIIYEILVLVDVMDMSLLATTICLSPCSVVVISHLHSSSFIEGQSSASPYFWKRPVRKENIIVGQVTSIK
jgi:hypothetical protein